MITTRCFGLITKSKSVFQLRPPTAALCSSTAISNSCYHQRIYPTKSNIERNSILFRKSWQHSYLNKYIHSSFPHANKQNTDHKQAAAAVTRQNAVSEVAANDPTEEKLGLFARFKKMSKEYWYVLLPVHVLTSTVWLGGFYYLSVR